MNARPTILALDLGTKTGWALGRPCYLLMNPPIEEYHLTSGVVDFSTKRFEGGGMRYLSFYNWLDEILDDVKKIDQIYFEEVRRHMGTGAAHVYGGFMATLTGWCEKRCIPYSSVPVKTIKKYITGIGNANKQMVIEAVRSKGSQVRDDNEADAIALLLYVKEKKI